MAPYDDWNKQDEDDDDELMDSSFFEGKRDIVIFCIDCSESMQALRDNPKASGSKTCHLYTALESAMQIQKRKVIVGPNDAVGIVLFNLTRKNESMAKGTEFKDGTYVYQFPEQINAPKIQELMQLLHESKEESEFLRKEFPPTENNVPLGDVFTTCIWAFRDSAPKTGFKRIFLITDNDDPHQGPKRSQLVTSAKTIIIDLAQAGVTVEPFFISTDDRLFDPTKFYTSVLQRNIVDDADSNLLPESLSISRIDDLLSQMRFREMPKRALFSVPFELALGFTIGVKGYGLITEQKKGAYRYFADLGDSMEVVESKAKYVDEDKQHDVNKSRIVYGMTLGGGGADDGSGTRVVPAGSKVFFTADELKSFRTLGLEPGIKLLGFKDSTELAIEDNVKHSTFIYPNEQAYSGSRRTFSALLKTLVKKDKFGLVRVVTRRSSAPVFCALVPQVEKTDETGYTEPSGFHLVQLPFADDLRAAPVEKAYRATKQTIEAATAWIAKLQIKNGSYPPDANPNPALAYHYTQLEASAFREEYDPESFEDVTLPKLDMIHKRAGTFLAQWKSTVLEDESANTIIVAAGTKRKADVTVDEAEIRSKHEVGALAKLRNDQLKDFLKSKSLPISGKKADLVERIADWLDSH